MLKVAEIVMIMRLIAQIFRQLAMTIIVIMLVISFAGTLAISMSYLIDTASYVDFFGERDPLNTKYWIALTHIAPAIIALLLGPFQLSKKLWKYGTAVHRKTGWIYVVSVIASASGALILAPNSLGGPMTSLGFGLLALIWMASTLVAVWQIRRQRIFAHERWMIYSYALTLAGVSLRLQLGIFSELTDWSFLQAYAVVAWSSWIPNLILAFLWNNWRDKCSASNGRLETGSGSQ